jgi:methionine--tRNA ligase beta chain
MKNDMTPVKPTINFKDLEKIDIRVGTILKVEDIPESNKLVRFQVDFGDHIRQIIVAMKKERENPQEVEGFQVIFVLNLAPKTIMGHKSEGMLLDIGYADGITPVLAVPEKSVPNGTSVG